MSASLVSVIGTVQIKVVSYRLQLGLVSQKAQIRRGLASYPIKASQGTISLTVQTSSEAEYTNLQHYIRKHHLAALDYESSAVRFFWASQSMDYEGFINQGTGGNERFNFAPTMDLTMLLTRDLINTEAGAFSRGSSYKAIYENTEIFDDAENDVFQSGSPRGPWYTQ